MNDLNNNEKVRDILEQGSIPEEISPENMKAMLDEKAPAKKRKKISAAGRIAAIAASMALIVGTAVGTAGVVHKFGDSSEPHKQFFVGIKSDDGVTDNAPTVSVGASYMAGAENYEQVYNLLKANHKKYNKTLTYGAIRGDNGFAVDGAIEEYDMETNAEDESSVAYAEAAIDEETQEFNEEVDFTTSEGGAEENEFSETYNQEEGVLEADIVKTDGKRIFYLANSENYYDKSVGYHSNSNLNIAAVDDGNFTSTMTISIAPEVNNDGIGWMTNVNVNDMYLYNDMIAIIGSVDSYRDSYTINEANGIDDDYLVDDYSSEYNDSCFVSFYTNEDSPQLIGTYWQDGGYSDVRISPDGYMYLVSSYISESFDNIKDEDDIEAYIPKCGVGENSRCMPAEDVLLPCGGIDNYDYLSYTVIGSIDLTTAGQFNPVDSKALAGYTGNLYSSAENIYTTIGWNETEITRISTTGGIITPAASGKVKGFVKDQFSMSEYNGYFRVAATIEEWESINNETGIEGVITAQEAAFHRDNCVYVLDMELNEVGKVGGFGENETVKSVNFSGDMGYVVTYEQTDPLFAIDLSDPAAPFITDEFKILGYSTYMQKWTDGLLLGFGADANEEGIENGVKLVMFDNSDPYNLQEVGLYSVNSENREQYYIYSTAVWERKALLIAPEKNFIGIPVCKESWYDGSYESTSKYMFFSYENGEFIPLGEIANSMNDYREYEDFVLDRAVYIGDYVYAISDRKMVSADIATITVKDIAEF